MEFKFTVLDYQTRASRAVVDVFDGQPKIEAPKIEAQSYLRDLGSVAMGRHGQTTLGAIEDASLTLDGTSYRNAPLQNSADDLLDNVKAVQRKNNLLTSAGLHHVVGAVELDVSMETGTGKTYVYTQTMFVLNARYGWTPFVIVGPSVAIREGVAKSLQITAKHFHERYGKRLWSFV